LATTHLDSVRVTKIFNNIIDTLHREMMKMRYDFEDTYENTILQRVWMHII